MVWYGMVWYGMVTLFIHGISFRYLYIQVEKTNYLTKLESKNIYTDDVGQMPNNIF